MRLREIFIFLNAIVFNARHNVHTLLSILPENNSLIKENVVVFLLFVLYYFGRYTKIITTTETKIKPEKKEGNKELFDYPMAWKKNV